MIFSTEYVKGDEKVNRNAMKMATQETVKQKFRGKKTLRCRSNIRYKDNLEREYKRLTRSYMAIISSTLKTTLPEIKKLSYERTDAKSSTPASYYISPQLKKVFDKMLKDINGKIDAFDLRTRLERLTKLTRKLSIDEWKHVVSRTLGIDLMDDYYNGDFYREILEKWTDQNLSLIKSIPQECLAEMQVITQKGFSEGRTITAISKDIQKAYSVSRSKALFISRDQMAKLNSEITQYQQRDAGVNRYIWSTSGDERVRESHAALDGKIFSWDAPPVVDKKTGRRAHPGDDFQCRCVALPVFDYDDIDLPVKGKTETEK